jgi:peptide/nickel transport system permease protein
MTMRFRANAAIGAFGLATVVLVSLAGVLASPYDALEMNFLNRFASPSADHWFGTDEYGRDVFTRIANGTFVSLRVSLAAVVLAVAAGTVTGATTGYFGGWIDRLLTICIDSVMAFPGLLLVLGIMAALGPSETGIVVALGIAYTPTITRIVRGTVFALRDLEFVDASRLIGNPERVTVFRHVLPNCVTPIVVISTSVFTAALLSETALSFLGLGVPPPAPSWGSMLADSRNYLGLNPWMGIFPGLAITFALLSINLIGDALRDRWDPRLGQPGS